MFGGLRINLGDLLLENTVLMICLLPIVGAGLVIASRGLGLEAIRRTALINALLTLGFAILMVGAYDPAERLPTGRPELIQMAKSLRWLGEERLAPAGQRSDDDAGPNVTGPDVRIAVGVDGISMWFVLLAALLMIPAVAASSELDDDNPALYYALLFGLQATLIAAFAALDVIVFVICLEVSTLFFAALVGRWGGRERRQALGRFVVVNLAGGLLLILGLLGIVLAHRLMSASSTVAAPSLSFSIPVLAERLPTLASSRAVAGEYWDRIAPSLFAVLLIGFLIRVPLAPFHTSFSAAHSESPAPVAILYSGVGMALGVYGLLRFVVPIFPEMADLIVGVVPLAAMAAALFMALLALAQDDLQKMAGYALLSSAAFSVAAGMSLTSLGITGAILNLVSQGLAAGILLYVIGTIRRHYATRDVRALGGLASRFPRLAIFFLIALLTIVGAPGLAGFSSRATALLGLSEERPAVVVGLLLAMLLAAWAGVWVFQRVFRGTLYAPGLGGTLHPEPSASPSERSGRWPLFVRGAVGTEPYSSPAAPSHAANGPLARRGRGAQDLSAVECLALLPLCILSVWIGIAPQFFLNRLGPTVAATLASQEVEPLAPYEQPLETPLPPPQTPAQIETDDVDEEQR